MSEPHRSELQPSGNPRIDEALSNLAAAADAPPAEQIAPLTEADRALRETLDTIGEDG